LPPQRLKAVQALLPLSVLPGALDLVCVWLIAQLTGALVRQDVSPALQPFGLMDADAASQSLWMIGLFVLFCWLASAAKLGLRLRQQRHLLLHLPPLYHPRLYSKLHSKLRPPSVVRCSTSTAKFPSDRSTGRHQSPFSTHNYGIYLQQQIT